MLGVIYDDSSCDFLLLLQDQIQNIVKSCCLIVCPGLQQVVHMRRRMRADPVFYKIILIHPGREI